MCSAHFTLTDNYATSDETISTAYASLFHKTLTDVCFKVHVKTLQDCTEFSERIQIVPSRMLMNNLISLCEGYSSKRYVWTKLGRSVFHLHVFHRWRNRFLSAKQIKLNAKAHPMSAEILIFISFAQTLWKVMSNENYAAKTSLLHDQKHRCISFH